MASSKWKSRVYRSYDKKVVICHPLCHNLEMWKLMVILAFIENSVKHWDSKNY